MMVWSFFSFAKNSSEVTLNDADGFIDLTFQIATSQASTDGGYEIIVKGRLNKVEVGFAIELLNNWRPQEIDGLDEPLYWGEAYFKSIGTETDSFIEQLAALYGVETKKGKSITSVFAQVVGLACNPLEIETSPCKMKFFFNAEGAEELYSEVYINVDLAKGQLEFNEKDTDYRKPLIKSLLQ